MTTHVKSPAKNHLGQTQYSPKLCAEVAKLMAAGFSDTQVFAQWNISKDTFYRWKREHEDFKEACDIGKAKFDAKHEELGVLGMMKAADIDYQFWRDLGKFRNGWTEKAPAGSTHNTQINIDKMNILHQQSNAELLEYIKDNLDIIEGELVDESGKS